MDSVALGVLAVAAVIAVAIAVSLERQGDKDRIANLSSHLEVMHERIERYEEQAKEMGGHWDDREKIYKVKKC